MIGTRFWGCPELEEMYLSGEVVEDALLKINWFMFWSMNVFLCKKFQNNRRYRFLVSNDCEMKFEGRSRGAQIVLQLPKKLFYMSVWRLLRKWRLNFLRFIF